MNKHFFMAALCLSFAYTAQAQTHITDANFANAIRLDCPACIDSNNDLLLEATTRTTLSVAFAQIHSLAGIEGFSNLVELRCNNNFLTALPNLPATLTYLGCAGNQLTALGSLPTNLQYLNCYGNQLTSLPTLPNSLQRLDCSQNQLTNLPALPNGLTMINCGENQLTSIPSIPNSVLFFKCYDNAITALPSMPPSLQTLNCSGNALTSIPALPNTLTDLYCFNNALTSLPTLPNSILYMNCSNNALASLPNVPTSLLTLYCDNNQLTSVPVLPANLMYFSCVENQMQSLPMLPNSLMGLHCDDNTNLYCLPLLPPSLNTLSILNTGVTCLPNLPVNLNAQGMQVCSNNANSCFEYPRIIGRAFIDNNNNNIYDAGDQYFSNHLVVGTPNFATMIQADGGFSLNVDSNTTTSVSLGQSYNPNYYNAAPNSYGFTTTTNSMQIFSNVDFILTPVAAINDLEVHITGGLYRPGFGTIVTLTYTNVGTTILNGEVSTQLDPLLLVTHTSIAPSTQTLNNLAWTFTNLAPFETRTISIYVLVSPEAIIGNMIHTSAAGTVLGEEENTGNNSSDNDMVVRGSFDPNDKTADIEQMTPTEVLENKEIIYTIRFQNTGTYLAEKVEIVDTLSAYLDISTLRNIAASHYGMRMEVYTDLTTTPPTNSVHWIFDNINLPDSFTNEPASHGFVKFSIQSQNSMQLGQAIRNKAAIYFDFNTPVITNTSVVTVQEINSNPDRFTGVQTLQDAKNDYKIFPNPVQDELTVQNLNGLANYKALIYNSNGQLLQTHLCTSTVSTFDVSNLASGVYMIQLQDAKGTHIQKLVKK